MRGAGGGRNARKAAGVSCQRVVQAGRRRRGRNARKAARGNRGAAGKAARMDGRGDSLWKRPSDAVDGFGGGTSVEKRRFWGQKGRAERQKDGAKGAWKGALTCLVNNLL